MHGRKNIKLPLICMVDSKQATCFDPTCGSSSGLYINHVESKHVACLESAIQIKGSCARRTPIFHLIVHS